MESTLATRHFDTPSVEQHARASLFCLGDVPLDALLRVARDHGTECLARHERARVLHHPGDDCVRLAVPRHPIAPDEVADESMAWGRLGFQSVIESRGHQYFIRKSEDGVKNAVRLDGRAGEWPYGERRTARRVAGRVRRAA